MSQFIRDIDKENEKLKKLLPGPGNKDQGPGARSQELTGKPANGLTDKQRRAND